MAYQMARLSMTLSDDEGHFFCFKPFVIPVTQEIVL